MRVRGADAGAYDADAAVAAFHNLPRYLTHHQPDVLAAMQDAQRDLRQRQNELDAANRRLAELEGELEFRQTEMDQLRAAHEQEIQSLIAEMGTGLIVEELIGHGLNMVTGDYSRGAVGQWVENGEIKYPVHEVTIAGNLRDLYPRIAAIGDDQDLRGGIRCGSVLVEEMTIAGA